MGFHRAQLGPVEMEGRNHQMLKRLVGIFAGGLLLMAVAVPAMGGSSAEAFSNGGGNSATAPGQANAIQNCINNITNQNTNGQTGLATGNNDHDNKVLNTAVTNCDHFWN